MYQYRNWSIQKITQNLTGFANKWSQNEMEDDIHFLIKREKHSIEIEEF